jgi:hypothetical protein
LIVSHSHSQSWTGSTISSVVACATSGASRGEGRIQASSRPLRKPTRLDQAGVFDGLRPQARAAGLDL